MMYYKKISIKISLYTREHRIEKHYLKKVERKSIKEQNLCKIEDGRYFKLKSVLHTARKKKTYLEFFWSMLSRIGTKYGYLLCKFTCSKLIIETPEQGVKYVQS